MTVLAAFPPDSSPVIGLNQLGRHITAEVVGLTISPDEEDRGVALRLLEIGFLPGESVRVIAHGFPGQDPLAVRVGHTTPVSSLGGALVCWIVCHVFRTS